MPLPDDLATAWGTKRHPIANAVRRAFLKNRNDTSTRLIHKALQAGYRMLDTLSRAANADSPEYASVLSFLRKRLAQRDHVLFQKELHPPNSKTPPAPYSGPRPNTVPLLVNTTPASTPMNPDPKPTYASFSRPRPLSDLPPGGKRKIPVMDMAGDYPILRFDKPQPRMLSRIILHKMAVRTKRLDLIRDWHDYDTTIVNIADCAEEDDWEDLIIDALDQELLEPVTSAWAEGEKHKSLSECEGREHFLRALDEVEGWIAQNSRRNQDVSTYSETLHTHAISWVMEALSRDRSDAVARAYALRQIIADEKALAAQEKEQKRSERRMAWEARMELEHGQGWREVVAAEEQLGTQDRQARLPQTGEERAAATLQPRQQLKDKSTSWDEEETVSWFSEGRQEGEKAKAKVGKLPSDTRADTRTKLKQRPIFHE